MTPTETVLLTRYVRACCPQQAIDEYTPDAWHDILGEYPLGECRAAVKAVVTRQPFCAPAEIIAEIKRVRRDQAERDRCEALVAPARHRGALEDPRPLREEIDAILSHYGVKELTP